MNSEEIIKYTSKVLPKLNLDDCKSTPINNGASDRDYFRINLVDGSSMVIMQYTSERPDNIKFDSATKILKKNGILSPDIIYHDKENMVMWLEDLGSDHLWDHRDSEWNKRGKIYMSVIDEISKLHSNNEKNLSHEEMSQLEPSFDKDLYKWEQDYFFNHFLSYYSRRAPSYQDSLRQESEFNELIENLTSSERFLIHRDLQSQNVIIHKKKPYFIDYQGLRLGLREYDIASLVYDPYVTFTKTQRDEIINYAFKPSFYFISLYRIS